jgi:hypothetical protein
MTATDTKKTCIVKKKTNKQRDRPVEMPHHGGIHILKTPNFDCDEDCEL